MKKCRTCGKEVEGNYNYHLDECYVKPIVRDFYGTSLYNIVKRLYPELVNKYEREGGITVGT